MRLLFIVSVMIALAIGSCKEERKSPHETVKGKDISVAYGRPYKKGRVIFGGLEPYGQVWRTGADEATEITFDKDAHFGGQLVKAGTYTLFTVPNENEWTIILNSQTGQWGSYSYEKYKDKNVLRINVSVKKSDHVVEQHTIRFTQDNTMVIEWDQIQVEIPVEIR